jgi:lipopolysaccharide export system permease protein
VQRKDVGTGRLYGIMIYRRTGSYEDQAIILADSGSMEATADEKHLLLTLHSGEWFENMRSQDVAGAANVPYRRETFAHKRIVLDFDSGLNLVEMSEIAGSAKAKGTWQLRHDLDSIRLFNDSVGRANRAEARRYALYRRPLTADDSARVAQLMARRALPHPDSLMQSMEEGRRLQVVRRAAEKVHSEETTLTMKADYCEWLERDDRLHQMEIIGKVTLSLSCIIFFFIGAPLGAIIRKGGLGIPVIISVLVFIVFYVFDNSGMRMARADEWTVWFGKWISVMVLTPLAVFFTYKANRDSVVFNLDAYKSLLMRLLGLREHRHVPLKEVIIYDPDYAADAAALADITAQIQAYNAEHQLIRWPNPVKVFFRPGDDQRIQQISEQLEGVLDDLGNTRDKMVIHLLNQYPIIATHAHTRPFRRRWLNAIVGIVLPVGIFFYFRMLRFRFRLYRDLKKTIDTNQQMTEAIKGIER